MSKVFFQVGCKTRGDVNFGTNGICFRTHVDAERSRIDLEGRWFALTETTVLEVSEAEVERRGLTIREEAVEKGFGHRVTL